MKNNIFGSYCDIETKQEVSVSLDFNGFYYPTNESPDNVIPNNIVSRQGTISAVTAYVKPYNKTPLVVLEFILKDQPNTKIYLEASIMDALAQSWLNFVNKETSNNDNSDVNS